MTTETTLDQLKRCRICGFTGPLVTPGIYRLASGKFVTILRCQDHAACDSRKPR